MRFVDTNVLLYAASTAREEAVKAGRARTLLTILSEDFAHSTSYAGVRVENPFRKGE